MIFVNVTIIYGTMREGHTYNCVQLLLNNLSININIKVREFFLSKDLPSLYDGCIPAPINSDDRRSYVDSINKSLNESDLIILASPVTSCDITIEMKSLLSDLYNNYTKNKTNSFMGNKIGLVISTASGAGLFYTTKFLKRNLSFLGINNTFKFSKTLYEMDWEDVTLKTKIQIARQTSKLSKKIIHLYNNLRTVKTSNWSGIASLKINPLLENENCNVIDFHTWKNNIIYDHKNVQ